MTRTRRTFTDEFKREAVKLVKKPGAMVTRAMWHQPWARMMRLANTGQAQAPQTSRKQRKQAVEPHYAQPLAKRV